MPRTQYRAERPLGQSAPTLCRTLAGNPDRSRPPVDSSGSTSTFVFIDLAGYTALTEAHGDETAADLVEEFTGIVHALLESHGAEQIKTIGDAVMLRVDHPDQALRLCGRVMGEVGDRHGQLAVRIGMHTGSAIERRGDWFGATVNLAARVAALARTGEVLLTAATERALSERTPFELALRGESSLKNIEQPVTIFAAVRESAHERDLEIDPVCRMGVDPSRSARAIESGGRRFEFCSIQCAEAFERSPDRYTNPVG